MTHTLKADLEQQMKALYAPLAAANTALHQSKSVEDQLVVQKLENQMNKLVDALIELDEREAQGASLGVLSAQPHKGNIPV